MSIINELTEYFRRFPGVGPRQAGRFVQYLLRQDKNYLQNFGAAIPRLKDSVRNCSDCFRFFMMRPNGDTKCEICASQNRDHNSLMIVAYDADLDTIEKSGTFNGQYFVLGGTVPILNKEPANKIRLNQLKQFILDRSLDGKPVSEIIIALSANPEGENTAQIVRGEIAAINSEIKISMLGRGLSTGTEIEYSDPETIRNALENRF